MDAPPAGAPDVSTDGPASTGDDGSEADEIGAARRKARELLFDGKEPEETESPDKPKAKPVEPEKPKEDSDLELSRRFAKADAQEKRLKERQKTHLAEVEAFKAKSEQLEAKSRDLEIAYSDPIAFLGKAGWDKDRIVQWIQGDGKVDPEILIKQLSEKHQTEMEALRKEREEERRQLQQTKQDRELQRLEGELYQEVSSLVKGDQELGVLKRLVDKNPTRWEPFIQQRVGNIIATVYKQKQQVVDPRDALVYLQSELAEMQLENPGQVPAVRSANPAAVEPSPITNRATSQRTVVPVDYDETDPDARRARAAAVLRGEIEPD